MQRDKQVAEARLLALLRLSDRRSGGFFNERQVALDKAITVARDAGIRIENMLMAHGVEVADLRSPASRPFVARGHEADEPAVSPAREDCAGLYPIAGFRHYGGPANRHRMRVGDPVALLPALNNPHDPHAVLVTWRRLDIGHLPRGRNEAIWRFLRARSPLEASISGIGTGPHGTVEIEIR